MRVIPTKEKFNLVNWEIVSVNPSDKNWNWSDLFCFWAVNFQSLIGFSLIASLYLVYDLNFFANQSIKYILEVMLKKDIKAEFPIEKIDFEKKIEFPLIKDLSPIEIVNLYESFSKIFPKKPRFLPIFVQFWYQFLV